MSNSKWLSKLQCEIKCDEFGKCVIDINWDETDPDLAQWISWSEEEQKQFILDKLSESMKEISGESIEA